ncbi:hypothetical protein U1Q18_048119 [Sarracenia purpurea var. burkii]
MTLQRMQALVRAQARVCEELLISLGKSEKQSRGSSVFKEEIQPVSQKTKESKREKALAYAFSHKIWGSDKEQFRRNEEGEDKPLLLHQWKTGRTSCEHPRETIKTVEMDNSRPYFHTNLQRLQNQNYNYQQEPCLDSVSSPFRRSRENLPFINSKPLRVNSVASPRCHPKAQTPTLRSVCYDGTGANSNAGAASAPNYMAATASAKARIRSHSAPRQRSQSPEKKRLGSGHSAKKRLSFPVPDPYNGVAGAGEFDLELKSSIPSCNSVYGDRSGMEQRSNASSCLDIFGDEVSSPSTNGLRRWLK